MQRWQLEQVVEKQRVYLASGGQESEHGPIALLDAYRQVYEFVKRLDK